MDSTAGELLDWGRGVLGEAGLDDCAISAEILLRSVLNISRAQLLLEPHLKVDINKENEYKALIAKRAERVPLQYLTGWVEFHNVVLKSDPRALIPRPETEILVEAVLARLAGIGPRRVLDIGTGTGNIAIAIAKNRFDCEVTGVDISYDALELASFNAAHNDVVGWVHFIQGDIFDAEFVKSLGRFDCVVSNPPYVATGDRDSLQPEITLHEPPEAVFAGDDPLRFFKTIAAAIPYILLSGGMLLFEVGMGQAGEVAGLLQGAFEKIEIVKDLAGIERVVIGDNARLGTR